MTGYEDLIADYSESMTGLLYVSFVVTALIFAYIIWRNFSKGKKQRKEKFEDDVKLQNYFEKYSDIIADKVVAKLNNQNKGV